MKLEMNKLTLKEIEILEESLKVLKKKMSSSRWVPGEEEQYWYIKDTGVLSRDLYYSLNKDNFRLNTNNVFETEEEAQKEQKIRQALADVTQYCYENDLVLVDIDWSDEAPGKYTIYYDNDEDEKKFQSEVHEWCIELNQLPYLKSEEACEQAIKNCEADLKIIFNVK